jgi:hypothetical protein
MPEKTSKFPGVIRCGQKKISSWCRNLSSSSCKVTARHDKLGWNPVSTQVAMTGGVVHTNPQILMDLEVKVRWIHAVISPDRPDLLTLADLLTLPDIHPVKVGVERVGKVKLLLLDPSMSHDHDITPGDMDIPGKHDDAVTDCVNRQSEAFGATTIRDPILTEVGAGFETAGFVKAGSIRRGYREIKTIG